MKIGDKEFPYSFSQNRLYNDCPRKYKYRYVDGIKEPTNDNLELTAKIALAHLNEFNDYYNKNYGLPALEQALKKVN